MPSISVIVPVYNVERYLHRCVNSIISQSFTDFELILVDDGSSDRSGYICDDYTERDNRVRVIHQKNAKLSAARNSGINAAKGKWIAFVDSDDWLHKDYLKILFSGVSDNTDIVICGCEFMTEDVSDDQEYTRVVFSNKTVEEIYTNNIACTRVWARIIRKDVIGKLRFIQGAEPVEDSCFNELLFRKEMSFRMTDAKLYYYYMRPDSAIHKPMSSGMLNAVQLLLKQLESIEDTEKRERIVKRCYKYVFSARYGEMYSIDYKTTKKKCKVLLKRLRAFLSELNMRDRLIMYGFSVFPGIYRVWRILGDPSLLSYERNCKKARNEFKKQKISRAAIF